MPSYLSNIPQVALKEILCYLNHKSILLLRKTCHSIRNSIDNLKSDLHFTSIHFQLTPYNVFIELFYQGETYEKCVPIWYIKTENGCEIRCGTKKIHLENEDFVDIALGDYELLLTHQNMTLDWFKLNLEYFHLDPLADTKVLEPIAQKVLERTETILTRKDRPLKTENFRMTVIRQEQAVKILKMIDTKSLKLVSIHGKTLNPMIRMKCDELEKLEQWKKAEKLELWRFNFVSPIEKLMNFEEVEVFFEMVSMKDVLGVKKASGCFPSYMDVRMLYSFIIFLQSSKLQKVSIKCNDFNDANQLMQVLGRFQYKQSRYGERKWSWFFQHSNSNHVLCITHISYFIPKPNYFEFLLLTTEELTREELEVLQ
ncbi:hypothetical protein CAEBREN_18907 [Caenorhabditis brenneri]|uniref:F-box domain-containing protein n=1 Tax=Caenorhabditis brenneri TaxID=135651 RepID=G0PK44_CAEBE|nr:hypothetical protein CAEBREN_18907 [Caenorhabditis brenneri]